MTPLAKDYTEMECCMSELKKITLAREFGLYRSACSTFAGLSVLCIASFQISCAATNLSAQLESVRDTQRRVP
jgi:hypothetical protein